MVDALRGLAAFVIAGFATTVSLGHIHIAAPVHPTTTVHAQPGAHALDVIGGQFVNGVPARPALSFEIPTVTDSAPAPEAPSGYSGGYTQPSGGGNARGSGQPAITIGSGQQGLINSDRAAAGLPPLQWS